jgi:hypothetical protein
MLKDVLLESLECLAAAEPDRKRPHGKKAFGISGKGKDMGLFRIAAATGLLLVVAPEDTRGVLSQMMGAADDWRRAAPEVAVRTAVDLLPAHATPIEAASIAARAIGAPSETLRGLARVCEERPAECESLAREAGRRLAARH